MKENATPPRTGTPLPGQAVAANKVVALEEAAPIRAHADLACRSSRGDLIVVGWLHDPQKQVAGLAILREAQGTLLKKKGWTADPLVHGQGGVQLLRVERPDVGKVVGSGPGGKPGFVLVVPRLESSAQLVLLLRDGRCAALPLNVLVARAEARAAATPAWSHSGEALVGALRAAFGATSPFAGWFEEFGAAQASSDDTSLEVMHSFASLEHAARLSGRVLVLNGWIAKSPDDIERIEWLSGSGVTRIDGQISRYMRPDLFKDFPWSEDQTLGFFCVFDDKLAAADEVRLRIVCRNGLTQDVACGVEDISWAGLGTFVNEHPMLAVPLLDRLAGTSGLEADPARLAERIAILRRDSFLSRHEHLPKLIEQPATVLVAVETVYPLGRAGVLMFGWMLTPQRKPRAIYLRGADGEKLDVTGQFTALMRPDVSRHYRARFPTVDERCGFACLAPLPTRPGEARVLAFDYGDLGEVWVRVPVASAETTGKRFVSELMTLLPPAQYRETLLSIGSTLDQLDLFTTSIEELEDEQVGRDPNATLVHCDLAFVLNGKALVFYGWIGLRPEQIQRVDLVTPRGPVEITGRVVHTMRPDLVNMFPWAGEEPAGYLVCVEDPDLVGQSLRLRVRGKDGARQLINLSPSACDWGGLGDILKSRPDLERAVLDALAATQTLEPDAQRLAARIGMLRRESFKSRAPNLPGYVEYAGLVVAAVDRAYSLGDDGLLVFGWKITPKQQPRSVTVRNADGDAIDISERFTSLVRMDVVQAHKARFPQVDDWCGFVCYAPMPTRPGEPRALCFDFGERGEAWLKIPTEKRDATGIDLIREILSMLPAPDRMRHKLYDLFSKGLGQAIEAVSRARPPFDRRIEERQYGEAPANPKTSVIVPLYGRYDFLRFQLAQFADDADFRDIDLVYVVDDPNIVSQTLELAAKYQPLFRVPFRVAWYGENRGFAGANNIGVRIARGDNVVLMNSDVIPQAPRWVSTLVDALDSLPDAGAIGPLLQFGDGSIQHAGMYPREDTVFPGFMLNTHKGMGMAWEGGDEPSEHPMLTAACLVMKRQDYLDIGGFDEGYVIGDFEDSDLGLALRKRGKRLYLVPRAKLWHLERQSQNLANVVGQRQLITLFNGWRYSEKIRAGTLFDPMSLEGRE